MDLRYKVVVDDAEARRKLAELLKGTGVSGSDSGAKAATSSADDLRAATLKLKDAQLANMEAMKKAREERAAQLKAQAELNAKLIEGKITAQEYALEQKKAAAEEKKRAKEARELKNALAENSEYAKLTKALNNVRKETKDVLAEMFKLEQQGRKNTIAYSQLEVKSNSLTKQTSLLDSAVKKIDATVGQHQRNVGNYGIAMDNMIPIIGRVNMQLGAMGTSLDELSQKGGFNSLLASVTNLGKGLIAFITTPVGAALTALASFFALFQSNKQTVIDFDAGMKNVAKTTGMAGQELSGFGDAIVELSMKLQVVSTDKLLEYATIAGQLGVKGRADILAFSESLAMLETASNISGEEGGAQIARMLTLVDGGVQNVKAFGDEIVNLGNNFAATEKEILENATQISQNVGIYKIGRQEVLAFATATKAVGLEAELVGSTFSRTLGEFEKTLRTGKGVADLLKVIGGNQEDLQRKFRQDAAGVFVDYVRGLNNIQQSGGSVNEALERTGIIAVRDQRVISSLATNGFDVLKGALDNVRDANGAMLTEFENGASKLEQQSKRMSIAWDNFVLSIENGEGVIAGVFLRLMDGASILLDTINKAFNPTSLDEFTTRLVNLKAADKIREINLAMKEGSGTAGKLSSTDLSKSTQKQINELAKETESSLKSVTNALNLYNEAVKSGELKDGRENSISDVESTQKALSSKLYQLNLFRKEDKAIKQKIDFDETEAEKKKAERAQRTFDKQREQSRQALERQRSLQAQIDALSEQSTRKQLSRDEEELASITDKYKKIREEVDKFYRDPKNKGHRVDTGKLASAERFEINEATTRQGTRELTKQLSEQREIYTAYNSYVEQNGIEAAEKMFGKQAELAKEYRATLQREYTAITTLQKTASTLAFAGIDVKLTQAQEERAKALREMLDALEKEDQAKVRAKYAEALQLAKTFGEKELAIHKKYNDALAQLGKDATDEQRAALKRVLQDDLEALVESSPEFRKVMENIDKSSQVMLGNAFRTGKETVFKLIDGMSDATKEQRGELKKLFGKFFDEGARESENGNIQRVQELISGFGQLTEGAANFDGTISNAFSTVGNMLGVAGQLANTLSDAGSQFGQQMASAGKALAAIGAAAAFIGGVVSIVEKADAKAAAIRERDKQYSDDYQIKQIESITNALQRQLDIVEGIFGVDRVKAYEKAVSDANKEVLKGIEDFEKSQKYQLTGNRFYDNLITNRNSGKKNDLSGDRLLDELISQGAIKKIDLGFSKIEDITQDHVEALTKLIESGKLDEISMAQAQGMIDAYNVWREALNGLKEEITGFSYRSLTNELVSMFEQGKTATSDFTDFFESKMQEAILKGFSRNTIENQMQPWYDWLAELTNDQDGLTAQDIEILKQGGLWNGKVMKGWAELTEEQKKQFEDLQKITGIQLGKDSTSSLKADSGIRGITEQTANRLESEFGGMRLAQLELLQLTKTNCANYLQIANSHLTELIAIQHNTYRTANNTDRLANIETAIVSLNNKVSSSDAARRGAGL
ncbi:phage tail tape measure protein [Sphingobacterium hotanense]|uniref:Phage tail tape measure protein n=1 Tax=Sphingobacterium hotanense TaxID=649196 RepID=A0ABT7NQH4_9SPHI|nr:phage tail tape measure protein [Sphingobacterium hotanense]MDM1049381.1 phage tail tape measure protein [Sphingobacterium hotanense]